MKLFLARARDNEGGDNEVKVFATAKERKEYIAKVKDQSWCDIEKHTCEFPATKKGIVAFFNRNAWYF